MTVQELRQQGFKVRVTHRRFFKRGDSKVLLSRKEYYYDDGIQYSDDILPKGGETIIEITTPAGYEYEGVALCSKKDAFNRKEGVRIALERALVFYPEHKKMEMLKEGGKAVAEFLEWLHNHDRFAIHEYDNYHCEFNPQTTSDSTILAEFFKIDQTKLNLEACRIKDEEKALAKLQNELETVDWVPAEVNNAATV